jgi:hypothetical protein
MPLEDAMRAKQSVITRVILSAVTAGSIATGIAVPAVSAVAPASAVASVMTPNMIVHGG